MSQVEREQRKHIRRSLRENCKPSPQRASKMQVVCYFQRGRRP